MNQREHARRVRAHLLSIARTSGGLEGLSTDQHLESLRPEGDGPVADAARRGIDKIARAKLPDEIETRALEAIILPKERPVIDVVGGTFDAPGAPWQRYGDASIRPRIERAIPSVGRVEVPNLPNMPYGGTGFVVGADLIMTNRHVAQLFTSGIGRAGLHYVSGDCAIDFERELGGVGSSLLEVVGVVMIHPYWDMALLRVAGLPPERVPLTLSVKPPEEIEDIAVIGYPAFDPRSNVQLQQEIFRGEFNVKRLQPGRLNGRRTWRSYGHDVGAAAHDASTLGGNSGSAVLDVATGEVAALHFAGVYLESNYAVPAFELARDPRVVDAGVQFAESVAASDEWDTAWNAADPKGGESSGMARDPSRDALPSITRVIPGSPHRDTATWTIPIEIRVRIGVDVEGPPSPGS